jgi:hypothetical protein
MATVNEFFDYEGGADDIIPGRVRKSILTMTPRIVRRRDAS